MTAKSPGPDGTAKCSPYLPWKPQDGRLVEDGGPCKVRHFSVGEGGGLRGTTGDYGGLRRTTWHYGGLPGTVEDYRGLQSPSHFIPQTRNETAGGAWSCYSLADCGGGRRQQSFAVGYGGTFEKDRTGPPNTVPRRPAPGRTDCLVVNTAYGFIMFLNISTLLFRM